MLGHSWRENGLESHMQSFHRPEHRKRLEDKPQEVKSRMGPTMADCNLRGGRKYLDSAQSLTAHVIYRHDEACLQSNEQSALSWFLEAKCRNLCFMGPDVAILAKVFSCASTM